MNNTATEAAYNQAKKRVEKEKGFYGHLIVYLIVNVFIIFVSSNAWNDGFQNLGNWSLYSTAFFWGIGLFAHGIKTFNTNLIFSKKWEERKIKEMMDDPEF